MNDLPMPSDVKGSPAAASAAPADQPRPGAAFGEQLIVRLFLIPFFMKGVTPWEFALPFSLDDAEPLLTGTVFSDRGVYRLGEEVHFKAVLRHNTPDGIRLLPSGTDVFLTVRDSRNRLVDERTIKVNAWSSSEWTFTLPTDGALGTYDVRAVLASDRPKPGAKPDQNPAGGEDEIDQEEDRVPWRKTVRDSFLVAAYRKPDFRVDVTLTGASMIAGDPLQGVVSGRYLFGAAMPRRPTHWTFTRTPVLSAPEAIQNRYPTDRWTFIGWSETFMQARTDMASADAVLAPNGQLPLSLATDAKAGLPYAYTLEGDVEDVSRQHIVESRHALSFIRRRGTSASSGCRLQSTERAVRTELVAVGLDGTPVAGVPIDAHAHPGPVDQRPPRRRQRLLLLGDRAKEVPSGEWHLTSAADPVPLTFRCPRAASSSSRRARTPTGSVDASRARRSMGLATATPRGNDTTTTASPRARKDSTYKPGDTARIMIQSPWEQATALVTTEREGIRTHRQFALTSTQQSIDVPITEADIPNVFVSVLLVKGRTKPTAERRKTDDTRIRASRRSVSATCELEGRGRDEAPDGRRRREQGRVPPGEHREDRRRREGSRRVAAPRAR